MTTKIYDKNEHMFMRLRTYVHKLTKLASQACEHMFMKEGGSEMESRWLGDNSEITNCRHTLSILNEYGWSKARVWLEAAWSKAKVCLEYASGMKYAFRLAAVLLVMMVG